MSEPMEQIARVVRARRGFGMVLDGVHWQIETAQALDGVIVQTDVGQLHTAVAVVHGTGFVPASAPSPPRTAKLWFWAVISPFRVSRSSTGWFAPWCPNFNLYVCNPSARPMI